MLDVGLPGPRDGIDCARRSAATSDTPIMMLTARDSEVDRMLGLELGADDYVVKPFSARELMVRVKNILRRAAGPARPCGADGDARRRHRGGHWTGARCAAAGRPCPSPPASSTCWPTWRDHRGLVLSRRQLLDGVWGADWVGDERTVDVHVGQLRRKLGDGLELDDRVGRRLPAGVTGRRAWEARGR